MLGMQSFDTLSYIPVEQLETQSPSSMNGYELLHNKTQEEIVPYLYGNVQFYIQLWVPFNSAVW